MTKLPCSSPPSLCDQQPNPLTPYSSEAPDGTTFLAAAWSPNPPLLNKNFTVYPCVAFAQSQTSQTEADLAATRGAIECSNPCSPLFSNTAQKAQFICANGQVCTFTVAAGQYTALDQLTADRQAFTVATTFLLAHTLCPSALSGGLMCLGSFFEASVLVQGADTPFTFSIIQGSLPPGIVMESNPFSVSFTGVPTATGEYTFTFEARSAVGVVTTQTATINVVSITTDSTLPAADQNTPYSVSLNLINASAAPVNWSIIAGSLPDGLEINANTGVISGTPTTVGDSAFTVQVSDSHGSCSKDFTMSVQSSADVCVEGIGSLAANRYGVDGYFDGMIPNPSGPSIKDPWDGTFPFYMDGSEESPNPFLFGWVAGGPGIHGISIAGNTACNVTLLLVECIEGVPQWRLTVSDVDGAPIWDGLKSGGQSPEGVYTLDGGFDVEPLTLTVILVDTTAIPADYSISCSS